MHFLERLHVFSYYKIIQFETFWQILSIWAMVLRSLLESMRLMLVQTASDVKVCKL